MKGSIPKPKSLLGGRTHPELRSRVAAIAPAAGRVAWIALVLLLTGCDQSERVSTNTVLASSSCKLTTKGLSLVSLAEVASIRGTELLTPADESGSVLIAPKDLPLFVALSRGAQPTRGFELHLADQAEVVDENRLRIPVYWTAPDPGKPHPQVTTRPCLVVSVPNRAWAMIEAVDQHGEPVGSITP